MLAPYRCFLTALLTVLLAACTANGSSVTKTTTTTTAQTPAPVVSLAISPHVVTEDQSAIATWSSEDATACFNSGAWSGADMQLNNSAGVTIPPEAKAGTYTFTVTCTGPGGTGTTTATLQVGPVPAPTIQFHMAPAQVQPGATSTITWASTNATSCTGSGGNTGDGWATTQPTSDLAGFTTQPITTAGQYPYNLTCTGPGGTTDQSAILTVAANAPPAPPVVTFSAQPTVIQPGQSTQFTWTTQNATSCTASGGTGSDSWTGPQPLSSTGTPVGPLSATGNFSYTLTCTGAGGTKSQSVAVAVGNPSQLPAVVITMGASPATITAGGSAALTWSATNATSCNAMGSWSGTQPTSGSGVTTGSLNTPGVYTYTLDCTGSGGSMQATASATVTVNAAPAAISTFMASPTTLTAGHSTQLSWNTTGATDCTANNGTGSDGWNGAEPVSSNGLNVGPFATPGTYTYTLTCSGGGGSSGPSSITVTVNAGPAAAAVASFQANPSTLQTGNSTQLTWSTSNATTCTASDGTGSDGWNGSVGTSSTGRSIGPLNSTGNFTYTLNCSGAGGASGPVSVTVNVNSAPPAAAILGFTATPTAIQVGQSTQLAWSTSNATDCTASAGSGADGWGGPVLTSSAGTTIAVSSAGSYIYALTCTGPGGNSAPASAQVDVTAAPPVAMITAFTATPSSVQTGQSTQLAWTGSNASTCTASDGSSGDGWTGSVGTSSSGMSVGPLNSAGSINYTLTCTGSGGASAPRTLTVSVTAAPPPGSVDSFSASPTSLIVGQSSALSWTSSNATSCAATGGTGSDGWNGTVSTTSNGFTVGPYNAPGTYAYMITCTGAGGASSPSSVSVTVNAVPQAPAFSHFTAQPDTVHSGEPSTLSWATSNASACTASGGSGADGWTIGSIATTSTATVVTPTTTTTYTLNCTGPGGPSGPQSVTVTVIPPVAGAPTVALTVNGGSAAQMAPGGTPLMSWTTTNSIGCTASGGTGTDGWIGSQPTSGSNVPLNAITTPGVYSYTLTCTGTGGSSSTTVTLTVISSSAANCGIGQASTLLETPAATASWSLLSGVCVLGCGVQNVTNLIDSNVRNFATVYTTVGLGTTLALEVTDQTTTYPAGRTVGFLMASGNRLLNLSLLTNVSVITLLGSTVQETATASNLLQLQALGLLYDPDAGYVAFHTTKPFNSVALVVNSLAGVFSDIKVYGACATLQ